MDADEEIAGAPGFAPAHPGEVLREIVLPAIEAKGVSRAKVARALGLSRQTLYAILNGQRSVTADVAARLGKVFGNSTLFWLNLQSNYDAWHAERKPEIKRLGTLVAA